MSFEKSFQKALAATSTPSTRSSTRSSRRGYRQPKLRVGTTYVTPHGWMSVHAIDPKAAGGRGQVVAYSEGKKFIWDLEHFNSLRQ
jgi:hypothetical protein